MKKLAPYLLALAIVAPTAATALAQPAQPGQEAGHQCGGHRGDHHGPRGHHGDPAAHAEHRARMLTAILDLDAHQAAEVRRILERTATEMQALRQGQHTEQTRTQMRALHDRAQAEIDALLNPAQRATMDRMEAARAQEGPRGPGRGPRGGGQRGQAPRAQGAAF